MSPITHFYHAAELENDPSTRTRSGLRLKALNSEESVALEKMIQLARKLATHPSILNAISIVLRFKWSNKDAKDPIPLDAVATKEELVRGRKIVAGSWPGVYADETNADHGWHPRTSALRHKIFVSLEKVQDLARALGQSHPDQFQIAAHTLLGAIAILHEACSAFRTRVFTSAIESQSPPAYSSFNNRTPRNRQIAWQDGKTPGGQSGFWVEDAGIGGLFGCVVMQTQRELIMKIVCARPHFNPDQIVVLGDEQVIDIVNHPTTTKWLPIDDNYEPLRLGDIPNGLLRQRDEDKADVWRKDCFNGDEVPPALR